MIVVSTKTEHRVEHVHDLCLVGRPSRVVVGVSHRRVDVARLPIAYAWKRVVTVSDEVADRVQRGSPLNSPVAVLSWGKMVLMAACAMEMRSLRGRELLNF